MSPGDSRSVAFVFLLVYIYGLYLTQSVHLHRLETGEDQAAAVKFTAINEGRKTMISYDIILYFIVHLIIQHIHRHIIYYYIFNMYMIIYRYILYYITLQYNTIHYVTLHYVT